VSIRTFGAVLGAVLAVVGFIALVLPVSVDGLRAGQSCGTAMRGASATARAVDAGRSFYEEVNGVDLGYGESLVSRCEDALGTRQAWAWPLLGVGVVALLGGIFVRPTRPAAS
jgi:hypothetical protein